MNYKQALKNKDEIAPQGGSGFFILPVVWLVIAFSILACAGFASQFGG